jgi:hypothetical protein
MAQTAYPVQSQLGSVLSSLAASPIRLAGKEKGSYEINIISGQRTVWAKMPQRSKNINKADSPNRKWTIIFSFYFR